MPRRGLSGYRELGFDATKRRVRRGEVVYTVGCSQCAPVVINGVPCHETGCPNKVGPRREPSDD